MGSVDMKNESLPQLAGEVPEFKIGQLYHRRDEIHAKFGGSRQSGISRSAHCPAVFLFTGDSGEQYGYRDGYDETGVFSYTGEGQTGDMIFKSGNKAVRDHGLTGHALHLFESQGKGKKQKYLGEFILANYSIRRGPDREGKDRDLIVFHLMPVWHECVVNTLPGPEVKAAEPNSLEDARRRALNACHGQVGGAGKDAVRTLYERSRAVRDYVLMRAAGGCEGCLSPAPFRDRHGRPYLEVHHTTRLSDGGMDHPRHVAALCPTCHRRVHFGEDASSFNGAVIDRVCSMERE